MKSARHLRGSFILTWPVQVVHAAVLWIWSLSKWLSGSLSAAARRRIRVAHTLNEDLLLEIMQELEKPDVARAALVCRAWLPPARWTLYHDICVDTDASDAPLLCATMQLHAHLRILIRHLHISHFPHNKHSPLLLDWIKLLPEHSLQLLRCRPLILTSGDAAALPILRFPAVRTLRHLFLPSTNLPVAERLNQVVQFQHLETLSIVIMDNLVKVSLPEPCMPRLKRLSIRIDDWGTAVSRILQHLAQPLERLDLKVHAQHSHGLATLRQDLQRHLPYLRHATFIFVHAPDYPFLDELAYSMSHIETLSCGYKTCTEELISRLPPTFRSLNLYAPMHAPLQGEQYARAIKQGRPPSMTKLTVLDRRQYRQHNASASLAQACEECGVTFEIHDAEGIEYDTFK